VTRNWQSSPRRLLNADDSFFKAQAMSNPLPINFDLSEALIIHYFGLCQPPVLFTFFQLCAEFYSIMDKSNDIYL
jgi:hypothetical protein